MALAQATKEAMWIRQLLKEIGLQTVAGPTVICSDNQGCIALARNPIHHARTKHIDARYHFVREKIENGDIDLEFCPTDNMVADVLTKGVLKDKHNRCAQRMGLIRV